MSDKQHSSTSLPSTSENSEAKPVVDNSVSATTTSSTAADQQDRTALIQLEKPKPADSPKAEMDEVPKRKPASKEESTSAPKASSHANSTTASRSNTHQSTTDHTAVGRQAVPNKQSLAKLSLAVGIAALGLAGFSGFSLWQQQQSQNQWQGVLSQQQQQIQQLQQQLEQQQQQLKPLAQLAQLPAQTQTLGAEQNKQRQQLVDLAAELNKAQGPKPSDWLQAEAEYLLRLANHRLQLEGDLVGAEKLLASADERLQSADNPALFAVREAIATERLALSSIGAVDKSGLYFALSALENQVELLPLPMTPEQSSDLNKSPATVENNPDTPLWLSVWHELKGLVIIRQREQAISALLPPEQTAYLRHNLRLTLQQTQIALMKEDNRLYQSLLTQAATWVEQYFDPQQPLTISTLGELQRLSQLNIETVRPDISMSLQLLRAQQKQRFTPVQEPKA